VIGGDVPTRDDLRICPLVQRHVQSMSVSNATATAITPRVCDRLNRSGGDAAGLPIRVARTGLW
jgi:hypothetical protein